MPEYDDEGPGPYAIYLTQDQANLLAYLVETYAPSIRDNSMARNGALARLNFIADIQESVNG